MSSWVAAKANRKTRKEVKDISETAKQVSAGGNPLEWRERRDQWSIYGLIQSGKTGVLTVTGQWGR